MSLTKLLDKLHTDVIMTACRLRDTLQYCYFHYTVMTAVYVLEPEIRYVINAIITLVVSLILYTTVVFLPGHLMMIVQFLYSVVFDVTA
ncbi:hypothetical protein BaRGS_00029286 [Batillaria attramentaria]|uniref:Uncharacterized protein n=1 Tax=Batillaria attramentaria TaxID=370345 RepID=A0ABD0JY25_9CAEN